MDISNTSTMQLNRRALLRNGSLLLLGTSLDLAAPNPAFAAAFDETRMVRVGLVTDLHYADKPPAGSRHYRETPGKLAAAADHFSSDKPEFIVELGDLIDAADSVDEEFRYLRRINKDFSAICKNRHYVLGNHCVYTLTKEEFLGGVEQGRSYYSFDVNGFHFIVLDSCFRSDGTPYGRKNFEWTDPNIPAKELEWLQDDVSSTTKKTVIFAHQRLDVSNEHGVKNAGDVRQLLEKSGNVLAVLQGHSHQNDHKVIAGIHYCTLVAMVEGSGSEENGFSTMNIHRDGTIQITGFCQQQSYSWQK